MLESAYELNTYYLYKQDGDRISGILPLAEVQSFLFGHTLVSTPFCVYSGPCADSDEVASELIEEAVSIAKKLNVDYLELRSLSDIKTDWSGKDFYFYFKKNIEAEVEDNLKAVPRKQRAMIRKGIDNNLRSIDDDNIDQFFKIYSTSVRNLGTPVYPKKYFKQLKQVFRDDCRILTVLKDDKPIASVLSLYYKDTVMPYYGGGLPEARYYKAYDFMYWELMRRSCEAGLQQFDFGRSIKGTGSFSFKKNWGFSPEPLFYKQLMIRAEQSPDMNPQNSKYESYIRLWKKLPLPVANFIGPFIAKNLG